MVWRWTAAGVMTRRAERWWHSGRPEVEDGGNHPGGPSGPHGPRRPVGRLGRNQGK
jgi:hypothetical protein